MEPTLHPPSGAVPTQLGRYTILRRPDGSPWQIGRGGMGATYKAFDAGLERVVVLKLIDGALLARPQTLARFKREARLTAQLSHPHIGTVYDVGSENGVEFFVMEFIDGENAQFLLRRDGPFAWPWVLRAAAQVGAALEVAWARGIIHRDITPANLMVVQGGGRDPAQPFIKVIDFGLARLRESFEQDGERISAAGEFMGTYHYASPEQCEGVDLDCRTDIYSLGATLWFLLCGQTPFRGSRQQVLTGHLCRPPNPADLQGQPAAVVDLLCRTLAKDPADRPPGPQELQQEIARAAAVLQTGSVQVASAVSRPEPGSPVMAEAETYRRLEVGSEWAGSYRLVEELTVLPGRRRFRATPLPPPGGIVCLEIIDPRLWADSLTRQHLHAAASGLSSAGQPGLWPCAGVRLDPPTGLHYLERASVPGPTLFDSLRQRAGALTREELRLLLEPLPAALDALVRLKIAPPELLPGSLLLDDAGGKTVRFDVFDSLFEAEGATLAPGGRTISGKAQGSSGLTGDALAPAFARLIYELCGGALAALDRGGFRPLVVLDESGNRILRQALGGGYPDCRSLWNDLHAIHARPEPVEVPVVVTVLDKVETSPALTAPDAETTGWTNGLGMRFRRAPGTGVDFGVWPTRVRDYAVFAAKEGAAAGQAWQRPGFTQADDHPVTGVNLAQAEAFCRWLSTTEGRTYRLPTDQEWSVAVGLPGTGRERGQGTAFPWGGDWPPPVRAGNYGTGRGGNQRTTPVGSFDANALGLYDLGGNVWEWCTDPVEKVAGTFGVLRGGSWNTASRAMGLSGARHLAPKDRSTNSFGFRVVTVARG